jgi:diguanylate cyclase (GGDEF)-like protein/PAS domain S-box-containing protein
MGAFAVLACLWTAQLDAEQLTFRTYSVEDGLPQSQVSAIIQDRAGYLWIGTPGGGLSRFDGRDFVNYDTQLGLLSNAVHALCQDRAGRLWIGTAAGLSRFDGTAISTLTVEDGLAGNDVLALLEDSDGDLWVGTDRGLSRLENGKIVDLPPEMEPIQAAVLALFEDAEGTLWVGTVSGLVHFDGATSGSLSAADGLPSPTVSGLLGAEDGTVWIGTDGGLVRYRNGSVTPAPPESGLVRRSVHAMLRDSSGQLWFASERQGVVRFDGRGWRNYDASDGLCGNTVWAIAEDREQNIWFGTYRGGVCRYSGDLFRHLSTADGLPHPLIRWILEASTGELWIGSFGGLSKLVGGRITTLDSADGLAANEVLTIEEASDRSLWIGTIAGISHYDGRSFHNLGVNDGLPDPFIRVIEEDRHGTIWVGTNAGGLARYRPGRGFDTLTTADGLSDNSIMDLLEDSTGRLWIATLRGVTVLWQDELIDMSDELRVAGMQIYSIAEDDRGRLWFGSYGDGLFVYSRSEAGTPRLERRITVNHGLSSNRVVSLVFDDLGSLWVGFEGGIDRLATTGLPHDGPVSVRRFGPDLGFTGIECVHNAASRDRSGSLWIGTSHGLTTVVPTEERLPTVEPLTQITAVHLRHSDLIWWHPGSPSSREGAADELQLDHGDNHLTFSFVGLSLSYPEQVVYRHRLSGFEAEWSPASPERRVIYPNIPPGDYVFQVTASVAGEPGSGEPSSLAVSISAPYWRTLWFYLLSSAAVVGLLTFSYRLRTASISRQRKSLARTNRILEEQIRERERIEESLRISERRFRTLYTHNPSMFLTVDSSGQILSANKVALDLLAHGSGEIMGRPLSGIQTASDWSETRQRLDELTADSSTVTRWEARLRSSDGELFWARLSARSTRELDGSETILISAEDVSEARALSDELSYRASHDALTGLPNRSAFENRLKQLRHGAEKDDRESVICYLDLDQFKVINDTAGHLAGDELLRQVATIVSSKIRKRDMVARLGGDEFAFLMTDCALEDGISVAEKIRHAIAGHVFSWGDRRYAVSASLGIAVAGKSFGTITELLSAADAACYAAKDLGRNRLHVSRADDVETARRYGEMQWVSELSSALDENRLRLDCQRIVPLGVHPARGERYEILVRLESTDGGLVFPGTFMPAAERYGLSPRIDQWVLRTALAWFAAHPLQLQHLEMCFFNLSGHSVGDDDFLGFVIDAFQHSAVPPEKVCFEITETVAVNNFAIASRFIDEITKLGCRFALDDFGSGVSSFGYLKNLRVDFLKIDGRFVHSIPEDQSNVAIVTAICNIARSMGKKTIAEWVEDISVLAALERIGIDYVQGYGVSRPEPLDEFENRPLE